MLRALYHGDPKLPPIKKPYDDVLKKYQEFYKAKISKMAERYQEDELKKEVEVKQYTFLQRAYRLYLPTFLAYFEPFLCVGMIIMLKHAFLIHINHAQLLICLFVYTFYVFTTPVFCGPQVQEKFDVYQTQ